MGGRIPPHCLVDVDVVDEEGYELAEEELGALESPGGNMLETEILGPTPRIPFAWVIDTQCLGIAIL